MASTFSIIAPIFLFAIFALVHSQKVIQLNSLHGANAINTIFNGTTKIYVSAAADSTDYLKRVYFTSSDTGTMSAYDLTQNRKQNNSDLMTPWVVKGVTTVSSDLTTDQLAKLTGYIYCTSENQTQDVTFNVYDVSMIQDVSIDSGIFGSYTLVFLNTGNIGNVARSTAFSRWTQDPNTSVYAYKDVPTDDIEQDFSYVFSNPVLVVNKMVFIPAVNDFSFTTSPFYLKVSGNGRFSFRTSPNYYDINYTQTKAATSTGFYMKSTSQFDRTVLINVVSDSDFNGTIGANSISQLGEEGKVVVSAYSKNTNVSVTLSSSNQILGWESDIVASNLSISTQNPGRAGQFYLQYYTIQGSRIAAPTTTPVETTTSGSATLMFLSSISFVLLVFILINV